MKKKSIGLSRKGFSLIFIFIVLILAGIIVAALLPKLKGAPQRNYSESSISESSIYKNNNNNFGDASSTRSLGVAGAGGGGKGGGFFDSISDNSAPVASQEMMKSNNNIGFKVGADQDLMLFRENIKNGHIPNPEVITYNGVYSDYHFQLPDGQCNTLFCPLTAGLEIKNYQTESPEYWIQVGLGSSMKESDYKRLPTNFIVVIDRSGSMGEYTNNYYYKDNEIFEENNIQCNQGKLYFKPASKCILPDEKDGYQKEYSNSKSKKKINLAMEALVKLIDKLQPNDRIGIVLFDNQAEIAHELIKVDKIDKEVLKKHLLEVAERGGTNMESGIQKALDLYNNSILGEKEYSNRIIFLTDAMPNLGDYSPTGLSTYIEKGINKNIYFTFMGIGVDFQQQFVQKIGKYKGTNYFFIADGYDFYRRLVDEFDYNFFPMIFGLSFKAENNDLVDKVYGLDINLKNENELFRINTLFPTPPTTDGYRGSIILLKLKSKPDKDIKFTVSYEKNTGETEKTESILKNSDFSSNNSTIQKGIILTWYVDTLKNAINLKESDKLDKFKSYFQLNKIIFSGNDDKIFNQEISTIDKLKDLLNKGIKVEEDYWKGK